MIRLQKVNKSFKSITLFQELDVSFPDNKKILIKGVNGCGKSVLLKMIVGYSKPTSGEIFIDELQLHKDMDFLPNAGVSINSPEFINGLTGMENLRELSHIRNVAQDKDIINIAQKLGLDKDLNKKYKNYSLGMKQKLRLIQALMDRPEYLILDEPFDALDQKSCSILMDILEKYTKDGHTLIFTSHTKEYEEFADVIYEVDNYTLKQISKNNS